MFRSNEHKNKLLATLLYDGDKLYHLTKTITVIGSGFEVDICIADRSVLKKHVEIRFSSPKADTSPLPILKVFSSCSSLPVYLNHQRIASSAVLKSNDVISFGQRKYNFIFRFQNELKSQVNVKSSIGENSNPSASLRRDYSPSICRYFRQINAKSLHIVKCIEKLFPNRERQKNDQDDDNEIPNEKLDDSLLSSAGKKVSPLANYDHSVLRQIRFLYQRSPYCDYRSKFVPFISQMLKREQLNNEADYSHVEGLRFLFEHHCPIPDYSLNVNYIRNLMRPDQSTCVDYDQNVQYIRYLFHKMPLQRGSRSIMSIEHLFKLSSLKEDCNHMNEKVNLGNVEITSFNCETTNLYLRKSKSLASLPSYSHGSIISVQINAFTSSDQSSSILSFDQSTISSLCAVRSSIKKVVHFKEHEFKFSGTVTKRKLTRKLQPKALISSKQLLITKRNAKVIARKKLKKYGGIKSQVKRKRTKTIKSKRTSISTLLSRLEKLSAKVASSPMWSFGMKSQNMTSKQMATLKMVLSDSFDDLLN